MDHKQIRNKQTLNTENYIVTEKSRLHRLVQRFVKDWGILTFSQKKFMLLTTAYFKLTPKSLLAYFLFSELCFYSKCLEI